jgi:hypothetical protein
VAVAYPILNYSDQNRPFLSNSRLNWNQRSAIDDAHFDSNRLSMTFRGSHFHYEWAVGAVASYKLPYYCYFHCYSCDDIDTVRNLFAFSRTAVDDTDLDDKIVEAVVMTFVAAAVKHDDNDEKAIAVAEADNDDIERRVSMAGEIVEMAFPRIEVAHICLCALLDIELLA